MSDSRCAGDTLLRLGLSSSSVQLGAAASASACVAYLYPVCFLLPLHLGRGWYIARILHSFVSLHWSTVTADTLRLAGVTLLSNPCRGFMGASCVPARECVQGCRGLQTRWKKRPKKLTEKKIQKNAAQPIFSIMPHFILGKMKRSDWSKIYFVLSFTSKA